MARLLLLPLLILSTIVFTGCGGGGNVTGKVTFDGAPIESGLIVFVPADGKGASASGPIKNGEYRLSAPTGSYKVSVSAEKMMPSASTVKNAPEEMRNYIPRRYAGANTELTAKVDGQPVNFDLVSDAPAKKK